jgi:hypothetical protein
VSQWPVVAGTLGAALIVGGLTLLGEHLRSGRARRERWLRDRRELAARFLAATDDLLKWATVQGTMALMEAEGGAMTADGVSTWEEAGQRVHELDETVRRLHIEIALVGTQAERAAAARLREAVWRVASASGKPTPERANISPVQLAAEEHHDARTEFATTARRGLAA